MRLQAIKLSGFKSFVDPTTVRFPSNLCAVVGPNGCGKSNVIDAVRWVMGESSAKNLRGESMSDVIFNGSNTRKAVGQASVELRFDNAEGRLSGEYASYNEISIQRKVTSDGQSSYYLNGLKCRRKDITDIFLGTGLGPRSYSIIEQGMISQLVEAKPDDLRVYIEEAAGISKYKERRRETERRISHTRENLERLADIREELDRQLHHLQRQARAAERYKELKKEERQLGAEVQALKWAAINIEAEDKNKEISRLEVEYEASVAEHRSIDAAIEKQRDEQVNLTEQSNEVQKRYYDVGTEIARVEEAIQHQQARLNQWTFDLKDVEKNAADINRDLVEDESRITGLKADLATLVPETSVASEKEGRSSQLLHSVEEQMHDWQVQWEEFSQRAAQPRQDAQVAQSRISHLEESITRLQQRLEVLGRESGKLRELDIPGQIVPLELAQESFDEKVSATEQRLIECNSAIEQQRQDNQAIAQRLDSLRSELQSMRGRSASLEALQQAALGQQDQVGIQWLERHGLESARRVAEVLQVQTGWETAVETVLGSHLQAVCVDNLDVVARLLGDFGQGNIGLLEVNARKAQSDLSADTLASKISSTAEVDQWVRNIVVANDLAEALRLRANLASDESVITRDGIWIGPNWLRIKHEDDGQAGVLKRQQDLNSLEQQIASTQSLAEQALERSELGVNRLQEIEQERESNQAELSEMLQQLGSLRGEIRALHVQQDQLTQNLNRTGNELTAGQAQLEQDQQSLSQNRRDLEVALDAMALNEKERERLQADRDSKRRTLDSSREAARRDKDLAHQLALKTQAISNQLASTSQALERLTTQVQVLNKRQTDLVELIAQGEEPLQLSRSELEVLLRKRLQVEQDLTQARRAVEQADHNLRSLERQRAQVEERSGLIRSSLEQVRIQWQSLEVRRSTIREQLERESFDPEVVVDGLPEEADVLTWDEKLTAMALRIQRLGAINLAAIDEYSVQSERKQYLDAQNEDLQSALDTLQNAIRKIDRETRTRFKETFDQINTKIQLLFPKLFGGGHAYLELTGDDLLDTGVGLMARPPGKKNTSIHLLSGGEKALTAIALVFAIFSLNPAPFCMLDEVDAPLDDANVVRYSELVEEMSRTVQFIYITHNKVAMEMAHQLMGVTMHEPGVSRLVTVDVDEAVALAAV